VAGLDALVVDEAEDFADAKEADLEDPDVVEEVQEAKKEAYAMAAAGAFGPDADINALAALAQSPNEEVRLEALRAIQMRPLQPALQAVARALGDESWDVRTTAVEILAAARDRESLNRVGLLLVGAESRDIRIDALRVLALRAQPESAKHLQAYLKAKPKDDEGVLRDAAVQMLAEFERRAEAAKREGK
jgi:HEAT repeat protein